MLRILLTFLFVFFVQSCYSFEYLIISNGNGGDMAGAKIIENRFINENKDVKLFDIENSELTKKEIENAKKIAFIGYNSIKKLSTNNNILNNLQNKDVYFYSHLYSDDFINFFQIKKNGFKSITIYATKSQYEKYDVEFDKLKSNKNIKILINNTALRTVENCGSIIEINRKISKFVHNKFSSVIWLGGDYSDSDGNKIEISFFDGKNALEKIRNKLDRKNKIAIIIHPRFLTNYSIDRMNLIKDIFKDFESKIYISKNSYEKIGFSFKTSVSPDYNDLICYLNKMKYRVKNFASVDQYNIFADLNSEIEPFLLQYNDKDQFYYMEDYIKIPFDKINNSSITDIMDLE